MKLCAQLNDNHFHATYSKISMLPYYKYFNAVLIYVMFLFALY